MPIWGEMEGFWTVGIRFEQLGMQALNSPRHEARMKWSCRFGRKGLRFEKYALFTNSAEFLNG